MLILLVLPVPSRAQEELTLTELERLYLAAKGELESAAQHLEVLKSRYDRAAQEFERARSAGDEERTNAAFTQTQTLTPEVRSQERRVTELREGLREARRRYIQALEVRLDSLLDARTQARVPQDSINLAIEFADTNNRYQDLLREEEDPTVAEERVSALTRDPRDRPEDLRRKAAQEEYRAERYVSLLQVIDERLAELREAQRRDQIARDFWTGLDRYGDIRPPGVPPGSRIGPPRESGQPPPGSDSVGVETPLSLEERILNLEAQRALAGDLIQQARSNARQYREWAGGGGG